MIKGYRLFQSLGFSQRNNMIYLPAGFSAVVIPVHPWLKLRFHVRPECRPVALEDFANGLFSGESHVLNYK